MLTGTSVRSTPYRIVPYSVDWYLRTEYSLPYRTFQACLGRRETNGVRKQNTQEGHKRRPTFADRGRNTEVRRRFAAARTGPLSNTVYFVEAEKRGRSTRRERETRDVHGTELCTVKSAIR